MDIYISVSVLSAVGAEVSGDVTYHFAFRVSGLGGAVAKSLNAGLLGLGFVSRYRIPPKAIKKVCWFFF